MVSLDSTVHYTRRKSLEQSGFQLQPEPCGAEPAWAAVLFIYLLEHYIVALTEPKPQGKQQLFFILTT